MSRRLSDSQWMSPTYQAGASRTYQPTPIPTPEQQEEENRQLMLRNAAKLAPALLVLVERRLALADYPDGAAPCEDCADDWTRDARALVERIKAVPWVHRKGGA